VTVGLGVDDIHGAQEDMDRRVGGSGEPVAQIAHRHLEHEAQRVEVADDLRGSAEYFATGHAAWSPMTMAESVRSRTQRRSKKQPAAG
jgi:hypothetical protein